MSTKPGTRALARLLAASLWLAPAWAAALSVGQIKVYSALNEPLDAEVELLSATPDELATLSADLASPQVFAQAGVDRLALLSGLQFSVQADARGRDVIQVRSRQPIREPLLNFLVELDWSGGRIIKEFVVLLEPSATAARRPAPARPPAPVRPAPVRSAPPPAPLPGVDDAGGERYRVARGDTLWDIAGRLRPDASVSVQQMMDALLRANPQAFSNGDANRLLAGATLRVPDVGGRARPAQEVREAAQRPEPPAAAEPAQRPSLRLVSPTPDEGGEQIASAAQPGEIAPRSAEVVAAPSFSQRFLIDLKDGRPQLQLAGLDDLRARIDTLVGVDDAALTAIQERGSPAAPEPAAPEPAAPEPAAPEPATPEPVPEAEPPGWMAFLSSLRDAPLLPAAIAILVLLLAALLVRRLRGRSADEEEETAEEATRFKPISLESEPAAREPAAREPAAREPAAPERSSATVVELPKKPAVTRPETRDVGLLPLVEKPEKASADEDASLLEGFGSLLDWESPATMPKESVKPPAVRFEHEPAAARTSADELDTEMEGLDFALEPPHAERPIDKEYHLDPELKDLEFEFEQVPIQEQVTEELHLPPAVELAASEAAADDDYVATKLDLAAAYMDMDDSIGARSLLEEVLEEGDERQKKKAEDLLRKLP